MKVFIIPFLLSTFSIVIDPGHGGEDCGICVPDFSEKEITMKIAGFLKEELMENFDVYLTRDGDYFVPQEERVGFANSKGDLFISIHINSSFLESLSGTIIYIPSISPKNCEGILLIPWDMANACGVEESEKFAYFLKDEFDGFRKVEIERVNSYLLIGLKVPGIVLEAGFYRENLFSEIWINDFIKKLGYGIRRYLDERKKE